jgi:DNA-binding NarL/FixJ family response regulator
MPRTDTPAATAPPPHAAILAGADFSQRIVDALGDRWVTTVARGVGELTFESDPDVVVLCVHDAEGRPADALGAIVERHPQAPVVVVVKELEQREVRAVLAAGGCGVLCDESLAAALEPCLHAAIAGQICVPREQWRQVQPPALSMREKQVLGLLVMGYMNSQIAERLFLAESTVKSHLHSAFAKLGVRSRNEAVSLILNPQRGLGLGIIGVGAEPLPLPSGAGV